MQTLLNPYENFRMQIQGEGFYDDVSFEGLPKEREDLLDLEDCYINVSKKYTFYIKNNSKEQIKFLWNTNNIDSLSLHPKAGHLNAN